MHASALRFPESNRGGSCPLALRRLHPPGSSHFRCARVKCAHARARLARPVDLPARRTLVDAVTASGSTVAEQADLAAQPPWRVGLGASCRCSSRSCSPRSPVARRIRCSHYFGEHTRVAPAIAHPPVWRVAVRSVRTARRVGIRVVSETPAPGCPTARRMCHSNHR